MQPHSFIRAVLSLFSFAGQLWAAISWAWGTGVTVLEQFGPPEYAAAIAFFTGLLLWVNLAWIKAWIDAHRPSRRFAALHNEIEWATNYVEPYSFSFDLRYRAEYESLRFKLAKLKIGLPEEPQELQKALLSLLAYAKDGRIAEARRLTAKWA